MADNGLGNFLSGIFGMGSSPYSAGMNQYSKYANQALGYQNPFYQAGTSAIPQYQDWLNQMKDPTAFINNMMGSYQESPYAKYQQQQSMNAMNNMASANGLAGSTPMMLQAQQNAQNISSKDMNQWLNNVLGINSQYGAGQKDLMGMGQHSADEMSNMMMQMADTMGLGAFGQQKGSNQDLSGILSGGLKMLFGI